MTSVSASNEGDTVLLSNAAGELIDTDRYTAETLGSANESYTRSPDLTGDFVPHSQAAGSNGALFSPGVRVDGSNFGVACAAP
ncbi:MAG: hypothetical protein R2748_34940 [Bryobacterales bacterium]